jgi:hypothetical protein
LKTIIMLFIRFVPNCDLVRNNHQKWTRLKRPFRLCSLLIGSYHINNGHGITNTMLTSFVTYSTLRNKMNLLLSIIANVVLGLLLFLRSITMSRICIGLIFPKIKIQRKMVGPQGTDTMGIRSGNFKR